MAERRKGQVDARNLGCFYYDWASSKYRWAAEPKKVRPRNFMKNFYAKKAIGDATEV